MDSARIAAMELIASMDLDELLEASKAIEMGIKGLANSDVKSAKAQEYAGVILGLNKKVDTKPAAESLMKELNTQILKVNRETTNAVEAKRLYQELMAEE